MSEESRSAEAELMGKPLRCPGCREVLGFVRRDNGVRTFRIDGGRLWVEVTMDARVECECGAVLYWHAGQEAIDELVKRVVHRGDAESAEKS